MTPGERERRIKAAVESWITAPGDFVYSRMGAALDAADKAVPMVPLADSPSGFSAGYLRQRERAERAEAAARDFAKALEQIAKQEAIWRGGPPWKHWRVLAEEALESFSGEERGET